MKEGDRVIIIGCESGHEFEIGEIVTLIQKDETGLFSWYAENSKTECYFLYSHEFKPYVLTQPPRE